MEMTEAKNGNLPRLWFSCTPFTEFGCSEISISGEIFSFSISLASWSQDPVTQIKLKKIDKWSLRPILLYWAPCSPQHFELFVLYSWPKSRRATDSKKCGPHPQESWATSESQKSRDQCGPSNNTTNCLRFTAASNFSHPKHSWLLVSCTHMDLVAALRLFLRW